MKSVVARIGTVSLFVLAVGISTAWQAPKDNSGTVEFAVLEESNWDRFVPQGKEVDAIYGDLVLKNSHLTAVIAQPVATRNANMTVRNVGGAIIDLSVEGSRGDQLAAFYPGKTVYPYRHVTVHDADQQSPNLAQSVSRSKAITVQVTAEGNSERPEATVAYELKPADRFVKVTTTFVNRSEQPQTIALQDDFRADGAKEEMFRTPNGTSDCFWLEDRYWGQAYGLDASGYQLRTSSDERVSTISYETSDGSTEVRLEPGKSFQFSRRLYPGTNLTDIHAICRQLDRDNSATVQFTILNRRNAPIADALLEFRRGDEIYGTARSDASGRATVVLPHDVQSVSLFGYGRQIAKNLTIPANQSSVSLSVDIDPGTIVGAITDSNGLPIACKVELTAAGDESQLNFGPETAEFAVRNLIYSSSGKFRQLIPPGRYSVTISHGPEYDAVFNDIHVSEGETVEINSKLARSVQTLGWVSGDFHSHSSPSGDNTSSQLGRVLNLVSEQIEFAPCTEHNRVSTYQPHIDALGIGAVMKSVSGIELTSAPLPLNHQNAFPMKLTPRVQDGGAPIAGPDLESQIERLVLHDNRSEKMIQVNHPDIGWMFYDKNGDGQPDQGHERAFVFMDVMEVHPIDWILDLRTEAEWEGKRSPNTVFNWLRLLNQGFRIYGVVNTDAHYNLHGSGWLRNWIQSSTDDPAKIDPQEMMRAIKQGRLVMSNGPYLEMSMWESGKTEKCVAGQDLKAPSGKIALAVRVQCPNWIDVNRVFVLINGRIHPAHDYSRDAHPHLFRSGVLKFDETLELELKEDSHVIVVTGNPTASLAAVYGSTKSKTHPAAATNPVFVDVDGGGFQPNKDTLGHPLPVKFVVEK